MRRTASYVLTADGLNHIIWWSSEQLGNNGKLVDMILSGEERLALQHLRENASCAPDINFHIVFLPCEHNLGCPVVSCGDVASHLGVLYTGKSKVADLEIAVLIHKDIAGLQITVNDTSGVDVFEATL